MGRPLEYSVSEVVLAVMRCHGMESLVAEELGCTARTVRNYRSRFEEVEEAFELQTDKVGDLAELRLIDAIEAGEPWAVKYYLKTKGAERGYGRHRDATGVEKTGHEIKVIAPENNRKRIDDNPTDEDEEGVIDVGGESE